MVYQSFKKGAGDSDSFGKLDAIKLPNLKDKRFLDLGCNAGFFCKHAVEQGASKVVGVDRHQPTLDEAAKNVPQAQFINADWMEIDEQEFDVIICLSSFHYAKDPSRLLQKIHNMLAPGGVFVFEGGIVASNKALWMPVTRGKKHEMFPTRPLWETVLLKDFAFRRMGRSVDQKGDPLPRWVYHCRKKQPQWLILSGETMQGKSTFVRSFDPGTILSMDWVLGQFSKNDYYIGSPVIKKFKQDLKATPSIRKVINQLTSPDEVQEIAKHLFQFFPREMNLVIEGYAFSNALFRDAFITCAKRQGIRIWHGQREC